MQHPEEIGAVIKTAFKDTKAEISASADGFNLVFKKLLSKETVAVGLCRKTDGQTFEDKMAALRERISQEKFEDAHTNKMVLTQLRFFNILLEIHSDKPITEDALAAFYALNTKLSGMIITEDGSILNHKNAPVYDPEGKRQPAEFYVFAAQNMVDLPKGSDSKESLIRKNVSNEKLKSLGVPVLEELPTLADAAHAKLRSKDDICERAASLMLVIQYAFDVVHGGDLKKSKEIVESVLKKYEVLDCLTPAEQQFFYTDTPAAQQAINITWQFESVWVLLWTLGYAENLGLPNQTCDAKAALGTLYRCACYDDFYDGAKIRPMAEILDAADFSYRTNWACIDARRKEQTLPQNIDFGIALERHRAFSWLLHQGKSDWDHVSMDA
jgi:hypothetical protein